MIVNRVSKQKYVYCDEDERRLPPTHAMKSASRGSLDTHVTRAGQSGGVFTRGQLTWRAPANQAAYLRAVSSRDAHRPIRRRVYIRSARAHVTRADQSVGVFTYGEHAAVRVVDDVVADAAEDRTTQLAPAARADHDQLGTLGLRQRNDHLARHARLHDEPAPHLAHSPRGG